ncbi:hypothetical protein PsYK624_166270 [Phanerochaete sordida]|uniref:Uncharacterized protein n=1 Tax=Phanerochaete sordida TaxID=48140 RepID=A0A9P3GSF5_9APHY|nr:hypothetical protein PsYK624_166270 [Phanerochaete sordida]
MATSAAAPCGTAPSAVSRTIRSAGRFATSCRRSAVSRSTVLRASGFPCRDFRGPRAPDHAARSARPPRHLQPAQARARRRGERRGARHGAWRGEAATRGVLHRGRGERGKRRVDERGARGGGARGVRSAVRPVRRRQAVVAARGRLDGLLLPGRARGVAQQVEYTNCPRTPYPGYMPEVPWVRAPAHIGRGTQLPARCALA